MKYPLHLLIHAPFREWRNYRHTLVGFGDALCVSVTPSTYTYDLLAPLKPRKGQEYLLVEQLAEQVQAGWTVAVWDLDMLLRQLEEICQSTNQARPKLGERLAEAWNTLSSANEEQLIDLRTFARLPQGHYLAMIASRGNLNPADFPERYRKLLRGKPRRPVSEDLWSVLSRLILSNTECLLASSAYQRWVKSNRPRPPLPDTPSDVLPHERNVGILPRQDADPF